MYLIKVFTAGGKFNEGSCFFLAAAAFYVF